MARWCVILHSSNCTMNGMYCMQSGVYWGQVSELANICSTSGSRGSISYTVIAPDIVILEMFLSLCWMQGKVLMKGKSLGMRESSFECQVIILCASWAEYCNQCILMVQLTCCAFQWLYLNGLSFHKVKFFFQKNFNKALSTYWSSYVCRGQWLMYTDFIFPFSQSHLKICLYYILGTNIHHQHSSSVRVKFCYFFATAYFRTYQFSQWVAF